MLSQVPSVQWWASSVLKSAWKRLKINTPSSWHANFKFLHFDTTEGKGCQFFAPSPAHVLVMHSANTSPSRRETDPNIDDGI